MSLTSYRAAPPRVGVVVVCGVFCWCVCLGGRGDLAATDFPASWDAVSWALGVFTAEFGMGSGAGSPPWPPGHRAHPRRSPSCREWGLRRVGLVLVTFATCCVCGVIWRVAGCSRAWRGLMLIEPIGRLGPVS
jgi:hypothetical protein